MPCAIVSVETYGARVISPTQALTTLSYCPVCNGQERDDRTIQHHALVHVGSASHTGPSGGNLNSGLNPQTSLSLQPDLELNPQTSLSLQPDLELNPQTSLSLQPESTLDPNPDLTLSKSDLSTYILRETLIKLECGHSQVEIEEHLRNTSQLIGGKGLSEISF